MASQYSGNFRAKHPQDTIIDAAITDRVTANIVEGCIACKTAHTIAADLAVAPDQVGIAIDLQNGRIMACQLGLFGYGKGKKIVGQEKCEVSSELTSAINRELVDGRLPCTVAWRIADAAGIARLEIGRACESLGIKINQCQLGAF
jgi:hypothetical protein